LARRITNTDTPLSLTGAQYAWLTYWADSTGRRNTKLLNRF
jgi:hypothetical protein